jgi:hypothetical protein
MQPLENMKLSGANPTNLFSSSPAAAALLELSKLKIQKIYPTENVQL